MLYGIVLFLRNGGGQITAAGLFGLGFAVFVAGASMYWVSEGGVRDLTFVLVQVVPLVAMWLMDLLFWRKLEPVRAQVRLDPRVFKVVGSVTIAVVIVLLGLMLLSGNTAIRRITAGAVVLLLILLFLPGEGRRSSTVTLVLAAGVSVMFFEVFFNGFGRLVLVAIVLSVLVALSGQIRSPGLKPLLIVATVPAIYALASIREGVETASGEELDGLGSVVNPFYTMVELANFLSSFRVAEIELNSFAAVFLFWVPRSMWEEKPVGFGRELVLLLRPELSHTNHSMAALFTGEWVYAFGLIGLILMVITLGWGVAAIDRLIHWSVSRSVLGFRAFFVLVSASFVAGQVPTLVWSGLFSPTSRSLQGFVAIAIISISSWLIASAFSARGTAADSLGKAKPSVTNGLRY